MQTSDERHIKTMGVIITNQKKAKSGPEMVLYQGLIVVTLHRL